MERKWRSAASYDALMLGWHQCVKAQGSAGRSTSHSVDFHSRRAFIFALQTYALQFTCINKLEITAFCSTPFYASLASATARRNVLQYLINTGS